MKKNQVYMALIILLTAINVVQLGAQFVFHRPPPHNVGANLKHEAPKLLELDAKQAKAFFQLATNHRNKIKDFQQQQHQLTMKYFDAPSTVILEQLASLYKKKLILTQNHFNDVYQMLNKKQKLNFQKFKQVAFHVISR